MDFEVWKQLRKKWTNLHASGHKLKIEFELVSHPDNKNNILAIDVIQYIDGKPVTETVQRNVGQAYAVLGIADLSIEQLKEQYKQMLYQICMSSKLRDVDVFVTMTPTSQRSGEVKCYLTMPDAPVQNSVLVNYKHYYVLNALRDKMRTSLGKCWKQLRAVYQVDRLEFYFEYP